MTHWHWEHTFAMHAAHGLCLAHEKTNVHLKAIQEQIASEGKDCVLSLSDRPHLESAYGQPLTVRLADIMYTDTRSRKKRWEIFRKRSLHEPY